jgi:uncharacterized protein (TIGR01319 family)
VQPVLSVDIGSTWTKAALFDLGGSPPAVVGQAQTPTTQDDLSLGFARVSCPFLGLPPETPVERIRPVVPIHVSSSAKGGLAIAAIGVVPDLTVSVARLAAASAGGRIDAHYAYRLTETQVGELEARRPDIVLLCGGTDGGNESFVIRNARALAGSRLEAAFIYAGNAAVAEEVRGAFGGRPIRVVENVMPEMGRLNIEPARAAIREVFLRRIVEGKGLEKVATLCDSDPRPTPLAVYELMEACPDWTDTVLIDMGGATTDVYSRCPSFRGEEGMVLRGLSEPDLMRTVEGDLGMRVGARAAADGARGYIQERLAVAAVGEVPPFGPDPSARFADWVQRVTESPEVLALTADQEAFDDLLAEACLYHAFVRHAGIAEEVWTPGGKVLVQRGKDLRTVRRIVASGGWLARRGSARPLLRALEAGRRDAGGSRLLPERPEVYADTRYLIPLLGTIAARYPSVAAELARTSLSRIADPLECRNGG